MVYSTKGQTPTQEKGQDLTLRQYIFFGDAVYGIRGRGFKVQIRVEADLFSKNYNFYFGIISSEINLHKIFSSCLTDHSASPLRPKLYSNAEKYVFCNMMIIIKTHTHSVGRDDQNAQLLKVYALCTTEDYVVNK